MESSTKSAKTMVSSPTRQHRYALCLAALLTISCFPRHQPPPREDSSSSSYQTVRLLDGTGTALGSFGLRNRNATASDAQGIRVGRASIIQDDVIVRNRHGLVVLTFQIELSEETSEGTGRVVTASDAHGNAVASITLEPSGELRLVGSDGYQRGHTQSSLDEEGLETDAMEVYGAPGTDLAFTVVPSHDRTITVLNADGDLVQQLIGGDLDPIEVSALMIDLQLNDEAIQPQLFQLGLLLYLHHFVRTDYALFQLGSGQPATTN